MSTVKTIDELFQKIDVCVDEMKEQIKKLTRDYEQYIVRKSKKSASSGSVKKTTIAEIKRQTDPICLAITGKTNKRCARKRSDEGPDTELCKLHNNPKYLGIEKYNYGAPELDGDVNDEEEKENDASEESVENPSDDEFVEVKLSVDADGDTIDQDGNIWCLDKQVIIGKKDLRSKRKIFFKTV